MTVDELLGHALGVVGMRLDDFERLTLDEFEAVCKSFSEHSEQAMRERWERMRMLASITIAPHIKGKMPPKKLLPLPWEKPAPPKAEKVSMTKEQRMKRMKEIVEKVDGIKL